MSRDAGLGVIRDFQALFELGTLAGKADGELLELFQSSGGAAAEQAFETLVRRHGPMVLRVCRNQLGDESDVQDAFQATFLVLVRRRGSLPGLRSVSGWLFGVASKVARRVRKSAVRRRALERSAGLAVVPWRESESAVAAERAIASPIVQEEVERLPERYRAVVILCYWQGLTQEQASEKLGCPLGTVRSRMARAKDLLRRRLLRRGLAPLAAAFAAGVESSSAGGLIALDSVPAALVRSTVAAAINMLSGRAVSSVVSSLTASILWSLAMTRTFKILAACTLMTATGVCGGLLLAQTRPQRSTAQGAARSGRSEPPSKAQSERIHRAVKTGPEYIVNPPDLLLVEVLEALPGRPISGERLVRPDGSISLGFYGDVQVAGLALPEIKKKIIEHLAKFLSDEVLGLVESGDDGEPFKDKNGEMIRIPPEQSATVFVDVTAYNSAVVYVEGDVGYPGRIPFTGYITVLDAIHFAGGVVSTADRQGIKLVRENRETGKPQVLPIDYEEITMGTSQKTNYKLLPGDRIVVPRLKKQAEAQTKAVQTTPAGRSNELTAILSRLERLEEKIDKLLDAKSDKNRYFNRMPAAPGQEPRESE